jgi:hypothetical protein
MGQKKNTCRVLMGKSEGERDHIEVTGVDCRIVLKWIFKI